MITPLYHPQIFSFEGSSLSSSSSSSSSSCGVKRMLSCLNALFEAEGMNLDYGISDSERFALERFMIFWHQFCCFCLNFPNKQRAAKRTKGSKRSGGGEEGEFCVIPQILEFLLGIGKCLCHYWEKFSVHCSVLFARCLKGAVSFPSLSSSALVVPKEQYVPIREMSTEFFSLSTSFL